MKKLLLPVALLLAAAGSWAFYPKPIADSEGYMMVVSRSYVVVSAKQNSLTVISPDGQTQVQESETKTGRGTNATASYNQLRTSEVMKLNELRKAGWRVVTSNQLTIPGTLIETTYLLENK